MFSHDRIPRSCTPLALVAMMILAVSALGAAPAHAHPYNWVDAKDPAYQGKTTLYTQYCTWDAGGGRVGLRFRKLLHANSYAGGWVWAYNEEIFANGQPITWIYPDQNAALYWGDMDCQSGDVVLDPGNYHITSIGHEFLSNAPHPSSWDFDITIAPPTYAHDINALNPRGRQDYRALTFNVGYNPGKWYYNVQNEPSGKTSGFATVLKNSSKHSKSLCLTSFGYPLYC